MARFDYRPPALPEDPALDWVLSRAFGPLEAAWPSLSGGAQARSLELARRLDLAARVGGRVPLMALERELGAATAQAFRDHHLAVAAREAVLAASTRRLTEHALRHGTPLVLLKHAALRARRIVGAGLRHASDVDVLVPRELARSLQKALLEAGYSLTGAPAHEHQLAPLHDGFGTLIELHVHVPGVRVHPGTAFVRTNDLIACGLVDRLEGALVPRPTVLFAHAVAHAFLQNAGAPQAQSPFKAMADLVDLITVAPGCAGASARLLGPLLTDEEVQVLTELADTLSRGEPPLADSPTSMLLSHSVASQLDGNYAATLRLRELWRPVSQHSRGLAVMRSLALAAFPSRAAMGEMHGRNRTVLARARDRARRPFSLLLRALQGARGYFPT